MEMYFTSDLHLGHENILKKRTFEAIGVRGEQPAVYSFQNIEEHDEYIIERWNRKVTKRDEVWILGDFSFRSLHPASYYLDRMKGRKNLILGNHDEYWMKGMDLTQYFESVDSLRIIKFEKKKVTLCHYPMLEWSGSRYVESGTSFLIHGHIHGLRNREYEYIRKYLPHAFNASVDVNGFEPVTFEELVENNRKWYEREKDK